MGVTNWLGQEIDLGVWVYRGARAGNTSSFKIGKVIGVSNGKVRVHWKYEPTFFWDNNKNRVDCVSSMDTTGSPTVDSLVVIEPDLNFLDSQVQVLERHKEQRRREWQYKNDPLNQLTDDW